MSTPVRRGLTMIELLAALGLLAVVISAALSWTTHATRLHLEASERSSWRIAAEAVLQLIHDDLRSGDFDPRTSNRRVLVIDGKLVIRTRQRGEVVHRYEVRAFDHELLRIEVRDGDETSRLLLADITSFDSEINLDEQWLEVRISGADSELAIRRYAL